MTIPTMSTPPHDHEDQLEARWLMLWRRGDARAGQKIIHRYFGRVYRFFDHRVPDHAEDLTQRTLLACLEARDPDHERSRLRPYLFAVAYRVYLDFLEQRRRQAREATDRPAPQSPHSRSPNRWLHARHEQKRLLAAIEALPDDLRTMVELYYWEELSVQDLSEVFAVPASTINSRLSRVRRRLQAQLEQPA